RVRRSEYRCARQWNRRDHRGHHRSCARCHNALSAIQVDAAAISLLLLGESLVATAIGYAFTFRLAGEIEVGPFMVDFASRPEETTANAARQLVEQNARIVTARTGKRICIGVAALFLIVATVAVILGRALGDHLGEMPHGKC